MQGARLLQRQVSAARQDDAFGAAGHASRRALPRQHAAVAGWRASHRRGAAVDKGIVRQRQAADGRRLAVLCALQTSQLAARAAKVAHRLGAIAVRIGDARQQQQALWRLLRLQTARQIVGARQVVLRQRHVNRADARVLGRGVLGQQVVIDHARFFVHLAVLIETGHGEHQIAILRVVLQGADELVIGGGVLLLLAQAIYLINHVAVANACQLRRRAARLQLWRVEEALRFAGQSRLVQHGDLRRIVACIALYAALHVAAHDRDGCRDVARSGELLRQIAGIRRISGRRLRQRF